jgi:hypothetical protein
MFFSINIPFKGSQNLVKMVSKVTTVSYLHSEVIDSAVTKIGNYKVDFLGDY